MKKNPKPLSSKVPPQPKEDHGLVEHWIADTRPSVTPIVAQLDKLIRKQITDPVYAIKWDKAYYGSPDRGWCVELAAYDVSVNIVFLNGSRLEPLPELGDETRYMKIRDVEELESAQIRAWIKQSCNTPGWTWQ